jgi:hypothetical protein
LDPLFELFFILGGPRVPREKLQKLRLNEIGGVFGGTQNNIISWIVKPLSILVARTGFAGR